MDIGYSVSGRFANVHTAARTSSPSLQSQRDNKPAWPLWKCNRPRKD
jgi:hypothetical protein